MAKTLVKLSDVARRAQVSTATVSRALSAPHKVSARTRLLVQQAAKECGYVPHGAASALRSRRTRTIGAVIPTLDNAIFAGATQSLQKSIEHRGYNLLLACHDFDPVAEVRLVQSLITRGIDGLVLIGLQHDARLFELLQSFRLPYVLTWALDLDGIHPCVGFRNRDAAAHVASYLLDIGHRRIAMIAGETANNDRARERVLGVRRALEARGGTLRDADVVEAAYTFESGRAALRSLVARRAAPSAIVCGNDVLAIGALAEARARGIAVPRDLSITGFDDLQIASLVDPALTTVRVPVVELGQAAASHLLARLDGEEVERVCELPVELIVRASTAPPAARGR